MVLTSHSRVSTRVLREVLPDMPSGAGGVAFRQRMKQHGASVTTVESIMFELVQDKEHPKFRDISALAKALGTAPSLLAHL